MTLPSIIEPWARSAPDRPAILAVDGRPSLTYGALSALLRATTSRLREQGVGRGDRVALVVSNGPEAATAFLGIASAATCAPLNPVYRTEELEFYLGDLAPRALVVQRGLATPAAEVAGRLGIPVLELVPDATGPAGTFTLEAIDAADPTGASTAGPAPDDGGPGDDDIALVLHTSGTTARPKIVPLRHGQLAASAGNIVAALALGESDRCLNVMPLFHIHGLVAAVLATLRSGGSLVATPGFAAPSVFGWLGETAATWYTAVPSMHQGILAWADRHPDVPAPPLRFIRSSSASLPVATLEALEARFGAPVLEAYGMTEAAHQMASNPLPPAVRKPGSVGRATGIDLAILGPDGPSTEPDRVGEVVIRGATVITGYASNPEADAAAFTDGWFRTGDQGALDADGYLHLRGRLKELINRGGEKVSPAEVEDVLLAHPSIAQVAAFAVPDARLGEEIGVAIVPRDGARLDDRVVQAWVAERLADFKVPRVVRIVDEIPKGPTGKVQRIGLAERLGITGTDRPAAVESLPHRPPRTELEKDLAALWGEVLDVPDVGLDDDFFALGGDSLLAARIVTALAERHGAGDLPLATFLWAPTVERYAQGLASGSWERPDSLLVPIQAEGSRPPFFFVHIDDEIIGPAALRQSLDPQQPFYGLRALDVDGSSLAPTIDGLAEAFLGEVRQVQPAGPYFVGGFCTGGRVALEMARRLREEGETVGMLGLVDPRTDPVKNLRWRLGRPAHYLGRIPYRLRRGEFQAAVGRQVTRVRRNLGLEQPPEPTPRQAFISELQQERRSRPVEPYAGTLTIFRSSDWEISEPYWEDLATRVQWERLPGAHATVFQGADGAAFAARLDATLDAAERSAAERSTAAQVGA